MPNIGGNTAQLLDELRRSNSSRQTTVENNIPAHLAPFKSTITGKTSEGVQVVRPVKYDVPVNAIYDRLSTGNRIARFENYIGATGNEERLAQGQSATEKIWNGLAKNSMKTLNYALDSVVGTGYGLVSALSSGELVDLYDNDFGNAMDDANKRLDYQLPNYYSEEEKSMNFLQKMGTANFWANDVGNGLAFVGGALIPSAIMTAVTGGAGAVSFGTGLSKGLAKLSLKTAGKAATSLADDAVRATINSVDDIAEASASLSRIGRYTAEGEEGMTWLKSMARTAYTKKGGDILSTAGFLARSSSFEAGMEARQALKTSMDNFMSTFEEKNGRPASYEDVKKFTEDATKAANSLYGANMAILSVSNSIMFGKTLGAIGPNTTKVFNNVGNRLIGLGTKAGEEAGTIALRTASKGQKVLGNTYKILGKPISEGVYEEGFQGVASKTMESYLDHKYDPKHIGGYDMWSEVTDAFSKQYGTKEGWTEMGIGMLIGGFGGVFQKQGIVGLGKNSWKNSRTELENQVTEANKGVEKIKGLNRASSAQAFGQMAANKEATSNNFEIANPSIANTVANTEFIKSQMSVKSPKEIKADFEAVVDNMQLSESDLQAIGGENNIEAYKQGLKDDFNQTSKDLMEANKIVDALGLNRTLKDTPGNLSQIGDAVAMSFVLGKQGLYNAQEIGKQIDSMVGTDGIFDSLQHYNNLSADNQQKIQDLQDKKDEYKALNDTAVKLGQQLAEQNQLKGETEGVVENARYRSMSEKMVLTQKRMNQLNSEIGVLEQAIGKSFDGQNFNILGAQEQTTQTGDIFQSLEQLSKLDSFRESLELSGKTQAVDTLNTLVSRYKEFSNAHREMNNTIRNMMDTNFFSSKEGKGLLDRVKGKNYQMDDSFKKLIKENNDYLVNNFYNAGISTEDVESVIKASLEDNENLSDREKYRLESIVRLMLSQQQSQRTLNALATPEVVETVNPTSPEDILVGDTIELAEQIDFKENGLTPIDQLKKAISIITKQLDGIVNTSRDNQGEIDKLQKQLQTLKNKTNNLSLNNSQFDKEINDIENKINALEKQKETEKQKVSGKSRVTDKNDVNFKGPVKYFRGPISDGSFLEEHASNSPEFAQSMFEVVIDENDPKRASFKFQGDEKVIKHAINFPELTIERVSKYLNGEHNFKGEIITVKKGILEKQGDKWVVTEPIQIAFGSEKDTDISFKEPYNIDNGKSTNKEDNSVKITEIENRFNKEIDKLKQQRDAVENNKKQEQEGLQPNSTGQREGTNSGQQTSRQVEGSRGQETTNEADNSDSNIPSQTQEEIISDEVYKEFVDNGNVSVEANKQTTTEDVDTVSRNLNEIDNLIDQRVKNYGLTPVDIFEDISETDSNIIDRAKAGEVVDINALQGVIDYLYSKYKEVVALKNDDAARTEKGLKTQYLLDVQAMLEEDLDYLVDYVNKIKSGESVQQGANKTGTETNVSSTTAQTTNEVIATPITGATTDTGINQKDVAIDILNLEEQIAQIEAKINELSLPFRIIDTKEYTRYSELLKKKDSGKQLEESEVKELEQLRSDIDQWLLVTGTVVDGLRLSDLVRQQSAIANTPITTVEDLTEITTKEVMEQISFEDVARGKYNSSIAQSYDAAMVSADNRGNVVVSNVTEEGLRELTPVDFVTENDKYPEDVQDRGNTILSPETVKAINSNPDSKITIRPTNKDTNSTYSYVVEFKQDMAGNETANPLKTDFDDLNGSMETDTIYDVEPGDAVSLRVDPQDGFNKNLLAKYKNAKTKKDKQKVLDEASIKDDGSLEKARQSEIQAVKDKYQKEEAERSREAQIKLNEIEKKNTNTIQSTTI
jgi:hypothetical protein